MKITQSEKQPGIWKEMKTAASHMWRWFTAAPENNGNKEPFHFEPENEAKLIEQDPIKGTPFNVTGHKTKGYWISYGPYKLTEPKRTKAEAILDLNKEKWNIVARIIHAVTDFEKNIAPNLKKQAN